jgi:hypothetical protein
MSHTGRDARISSSCGVGGFMDAYGSRNSPPPARRGHVASLDEQHGVVARRQLLELVIGPGASVSAKGGSAGPSQSRSQPK